MFVEVLTPKFPSLVNNASFICIMDHVCKSKFVFSYGANFLEAFSSTFFSFTSETHKVLMK